MSRPDNDGEIIALYEALSAITGTMLAAARAEDWDLLTGLEARRSGYVQTLKQAATQEQALPSPQREQVIRIIQKILADDLDMRQLGSARLEQLASLLHSAKTERKLTDAYA
jgi:flagellar protein FliT